jgi:DNA-binding beta-propeller fold protein YncE
MRVRRVSQCLAFVLSASWLLPQAADSMHATQMHMRAASAVTVSTHTGFHDLAPLYTDARGNVYVQTGLKEGILVFSPSGHLLRQLGGLSLAGDACGPWGIAVGPDARIYVADCGTIWVYGMSGTRPTPWYSPSTGASALSTAWNIVFDRQGIAYVSDFDNNRIVKISRSGKFLGALAAGTIIGPWGLAIDRAGDLDVVEHRANSLARIAPDGTVLARTDLSAHASPLSPTDLAVGLHGVIYLNARDDDQILRLSATGKFTGFLAQFGTAPRRVNHPMGLATDTQGNIYVSDAGNNRIEKFAPSGALLAIWTP